MTLESSTRQDAAIPAYASRQNPASAIDPQHQLMECFSIHKSNIDESTNGNGWTNILKEVRQQPGCSVAALGYSSESPTGASEFVVIEWKDVNSRARFLASERSGRLIDAVAHMQNVLIQPIDCAFQIIRAHPIGPPALYEVWTAFFPLSLSVTAIKSVEQNKGPIHFGRMSGPDNPLDPMDGFLSQHHGWADGEFEYQGQHVRRMVYFFHWRDEESQQHYKREVCWSTCDGRKVGHNAVEVFVYDLEEQGMLGYEVQHIRILEVTPY